MPRARNPKHTGQTKWGSPRTAEEARRDRATFAPATHRLLLAQYEREEIERRKLYGRSRTGIWSELARISGLERNRLRDLRRDVRYSPTPAEREALAVSTGILPVERWCKPDPKPVTEKLTGE